MNNNHDTGLSPHEPEYEVVIQSHPLDIRTDAALDDPALVDLETCQAAVHEERLQKEEAQLQKRQQRLREMYGEQMQAAPTQEEHNPEKIMKVSSAEDALKALCGA